jgi:hypothetical protein
MTRRRGRVTVYPDAKREWRWRAVSANGRNLANSGEGYTKRAHAARMARIEADARGFVLVVTDRKGSA